MVKRFTLEIFVAFTLLLPSFAAGPMKLTVVKIDQDRRYVLAEKQVPASRLAAPFKMTDESGKAVKCQWEPSGDGQLVRWVVMDIASGTSPTFTLDHADSPPSEKSGITIKQLDGGSISISNADH